MLITALIVLFRCFKSRLGKGKHHQVLSFFSLHPPITSECVSDWLISTYWKYLSYLKLWKKIKYQEQSFFSPIQNCAHLCINRCLLTLVMGVIYEFEPFLFPSSAGITFFHILHASIAKKFHKQVSQIWTCYCPLLWQMCIYISSFDRRHYCRDPLQTKTWARNISTLLSTDLPESEKTSALARKSCVYV